MPNPGMINVWVETETLEDDSKAALPRLGKNRAAELVQMPSDALAAQVKTFLADFQPVFEVQPQKSGGFEIDEIELSLTVNASGGIELIGKLSAGVQSSIKLKLKRRTP